MNRSHLSFVNSQHFSFLDLLDSNQDYHHAFESEQYVISSQKLSFVFISKFFLALVDTWSRSGRSHIGFTSCQIQNIMSDISWPVGRVVIAMSLVWGFLWRSN